MFTKYTDLIGHPGSNWCHLQVLDLRNMHSFACTLNRSKVMGKIKVCRYMLDKMIKDKQTKSNLKPKFSIGLSKWGSLYLLLIELSRLAWTIQNGKSGFKMCILGIQWKCCLKIHALNYLIRAYNNSLSLCFCGLYVERNQQTCRKPPVFTVFLDEGFVEFYKGTQ